MDLEYPQLPVVGAGAAALPEASAYQHLWRLAGEVEALRKENSKAAECIDKSQILQGILISPELTQDNINQLIDELRKETNSRIFNFFETNAHFNNLMLLVGPQKIYQQKLVFAFLGMEAENLEDFAYAVYKNAKLDSIFYAPGRTCHDIYTIIEACCDVFESDKDFDDFINALDRSIQVMKPDDTISFIVDDLIGQLFGSEDENDLEID